MRLFVSINLKEDLLQEVRLLQQQLSAREDARLSPARHVHITLGFLGKVEPENAGWIAEALSNVKFFPFGVRPTHLGVFGGRKHPRVIWLGLEPCDPLVELHCKIKEALEEVYPSAFSKGRFEPHITLTRVKQTYSSKTLMAAIDTATIPQLQLKVEGFSLMQSTLHSEGATYTELGYYPATYT